MVHNGCGGETVERRPLLAIDDVPLAVHFEGSAFVVAEKPRGMAVHPDDAAGRGTLVNALFQQNRWLAAMETSTRPGVVHVLRPEDRGLVLVAKSDRGWDELQQAHADGRIDFRFRARMPADLRPPREGPVSVVAERVYGGSRLVDLDTAVGDTAALLERWLGPAAQGADVEFVCYGIENPVPSEERRHRTALGERVPLPDIDVYTAPT
jgi:hypothetical protein